MASKKLTTDEIDERIRQLQELKKQNIAKEKEKERKERSHRLIQIGAIFEKYLHTQTPEQAEELAKRLSENYALKNSPAE